MNHFFIKIEQVKYVLEQNYVLYLVNVKVFPVLSIIHRFINEKKNLIDEETSILQNTVLS